MAAASVHGNTIKIGPFGKHGGHSFDFGQSVSHITKVNLFSGDVVENLEIFYVNNQNACKRDGAGGRGGTQHEFDLRGDEHIIWVGGSFKSYDGEICISQLEFKTNSGKHKKFGPGGGEKFSVPIAAGRVAGFFGTCGRYINSIGVYVAPV